MGWMWEDDQDPDSEIRPIYVEGAPRLQAGQRYLALLVRSAGEWFPLRDTAVMTLGSDDRVTAEVEAGPLSPAATALKGKTVADARSILAATAPDPLAARLAHLPPRKRAAAVARERG
jgi:hypothetical protein